MNYILEGNYILCALKSALFYQLCISVSTSEESVDESKEHESINFIEFISF